MEAAQNEKTWFGQPRGVSTLFFTEMWERFSYYGMRAFLILYMTASASAANGGLGFDDAHAGRIYGLYTGSVWMATIGGGIIADWLLGQYRSVLVGAVLITFGHVSLAFHALPFFYTGLILIVIGTGLLKPNVSTMVGSLYDKNDPRRDAGFSIFYMGINLGAAIGPLVAGYLAQRVNWHIGFGCAAIGMTLGLIQYIVGRKYLKPALDRLDQQKRDSRSAGKARGFNFTPEEWKRVAAVVAFFLFASIFWGAYEQAGSTLNLFADRYTRLSILGMSFPSSWFQSVPAIFVIILAPIAAWLWVRLGPKEPSSPAKFTYGLFFVGLSFLLLVPAGTLVQNYTGVRVGPYWLVGVYLLQVMGEMCVGPVGLSLVTKLAPQKIVGMMMGVWFLSIAVGDIIAGWLAGFIEVYPLPKLFGMVSAIEIAAAFALLALIKPIRKLMGGVH